MPELEQKTWSPKFFFEFGKHMTTLSASILVIVAGYLNVLRQASFLNADTISDVHKIDLIYLFAFFGTIIFLIIGTTQSIFLMALVAIDGIEYGSAEQQMLRIGVYRKFVFGILICFMISLLLLGLSSIYITIFR